MINGRVLLAIGLTLSLAAGGCLGSFAPAGASYYANAAGGDTPEFNELDSSKSEMRRVIERYVADRGSLSRSYPVEIVARAAGALQAVLFRLAAPRSAKLNFDTLSQDGKVDYLLFKSHLESRTAAVGASEQDRWPRSRRSSRSRKRLPTWPKRAAGWRRLIRAKVAATLNDSEQTDRGDAPLGRSRACAASRARSRESVANRAASDGQQPAQARCERGSVITTATTRSSPGGWTSLTKRWISRSAITAPS